MTSEERMNAVRQTYDRVAQDYAREISGELEHKPLDRALLDCFAELAGAQGVVADIGCGPGNVGRYLHDRGVEVVGLDLSPVMVTTARRLNPEMTFEVGNMLALDVPDGAWAGIVAFYSLIHLTPADLPRACGEFYRTLSDGGRTLVAFHIGDEHVHRDEWWGHEVDLDAYFFALDDVANALGSAGFTLEARIEREPDQSVEYPSRRGYILAHKPDAPTG